MDEEKDPQPTSPVAEEAQPAKKAKKPLSKKEKDNYWRDCCPFCYWRSWRQR